MLLAVGSTRGGLGRNQRKEARLSTEKKEPQTGTPTITKRAIAQSGDFDRIGGGEIKSPDFQFGRLSFAALSARARMPMTITDDCMSACREELG